MLNILNFGCQITLVNYRLSLHLHAPVWKEYRGISIKGWN